MNGSSGALCCKKLLCAFWPEKRKKFSAEGCSVCSIGHVHSISIRMPVDMDAKEADAITVAESVDVFIFLRFLCQGLLVMLIFGAVIIGV